MLDYESMFRAERAKVEELEETIRQMRAGFFEPEFIRPDAWPVHLTDGEKCFCEVFLNAKPNRLVTREFLLEALKAAPRAWIFDYADTSKIVDVYACKIRKKLKPYGVTITTVWGKGFVLTDADVLSWKKFISENHAICEDPAI